MQISWSGAKAWMLFDRKQEEKGRGKWKWKGTGNSALVVV